jgi:hypothetical protein
MPITRRTLLTAVPLAGLVSGIRLRAAPPPGIPASFPSHDPDLVKETVVAAHGNLQRIRELVEARPALAKATYDWGYGDWESALGGASHMGNREIAELLIRHGAAPTVFSAAMLGQLDVVRAFVTLSPGAQRMRGPHGLTLLAHAKAGGGAAAEVVKYLESLGDADPRYSVEPLSEADQIAVIGAYAFSGTSTDRLIVAAGTRGLSIKRDGAIERGLFHLGGRVFHPAGAEAVRIKFETAAQPAGYLVVEDGPVVVKATRA